MLIITHNIAPMREYESSKQEFFRGSPALEFSPQQVSLWQGMKPINVSDCDRIIIDESTIEFQRDRETYLSCLDQKPPLFISSPYILPFWN